MPPLPPSQLVPTSSSAPVSSTNNLPNNFNNQAGQNVFPVERTRDVNSASSNSNLKTLLVEIDEQQEQKTVFEKAASAFNRFSDWFMGRKPQGDLYQKVEASVEDHLSKISGSGRAMRSADSAELVEKIVSELSQRRDVKALQSNEESLNRVVRSIADAINVQNYINPEISNVQNWNSIINSYQYASSTQKNQATTDYNNALAAQNTANNAGSSSSTAFGAESVFNNAWYDIDQLLINAVISDYNNKINANPLSSSSEKSQAATDLQNAQTAVTNMNSYIASASTQGKKVPDNSNINSYVTTINNALSDIQNLYNTVSARTTTTQATTTTTTTTTLAPTTTTLSTTPQPTTTSATTTKTTTTEQKIDISTLNSFANDDNSQNSSNDGLTEGDKIGISLGATSLALTLAAMVKRFIDHRRNRRIPQNQVVQLQQIAHGQPPVVPPPQLAQPQAATPPQPQLQLVQPPTPGSAPRPVAVVPSQSAASSLSKSPNNSSSSSSKC